jgi:hypothetical protein
VSRKVPSAWLFTTRAGLGSTFVALREGEAYVSGTGTLAISCKEAQCVEVDQSAGFSSLWSFTHLGHAAHPSVVKRILQTKPDGYHIEMNVLCEAERASCGALVRSFEALNERVRQSVRDGK